MNERIAAVKPSLVDIFRIALSCRSGGFEHNPSVQNLNQKESGIMHNRKLFRCKLCATPSESQRCKVYFWLEMVMARELAICAYKHSGLSFSRVFTGAEMNELFLYGIF